MKRENKNLLEGVFLVILLVVAGKYLLPILPFVVGALIALLAHVNVYLGIAVSVLCIVVFGLLVGYGRVREYFKFDASKKNGSDQDKK